VRNLRLLATALGAVITGIGFLGIADPSLLLEVGRSLQNAGALYVVAAVRVAFGVLLVWVASASRMPTALRVIGTIIAVAGVLTPFLGIERTQAMLAWWAGQGSLFMRVWSSLAVVFGLFIIYVVYPRRPAA
jgi:hypothetical protein